MLVIGHECTVSAKDDDSTCPMTCRKKLTKTIVNDMAGGNKPDMPVHSNAWPMTKDPPGSQGIAVAPGFTLIDKTGDADNCSYEYRHKDGGGIWYFRHDA